MLIGLFGWLRVPPARKGRGYLFLTKYFMNLFLGLQGPLFEQSLFLKRQNKTPKNGRYAEI